MTDQLQAENAQRVQKTRPVTNVVRPVTFHVTAPTHLPKVPDVAMVVDFLPVVVAVDPRNATRCVSLGTFDGRRLTKGSRLVWPSRSYCP